jgi:hypothetical protein
MSCRLQIKRWPHAYDSYDDVKESPSSSTPTDFDLPEAEDYKLNFF